MTKGIATFRHSDVVRAMKAVAAAGAKVAKIEIGTDGRIVLTLKDGAEVSSDRDDNSVVKLRKRFDAKYPQG